MNGLDFDLHSRILVSLAEVLADARAKTTTDEVNRLLNKCPPISVLPFEEINIVQPGQAQIGRMTVRHQQTLDALLKYATKANEYTQLELLPRIISYLKYLPVYDWNNIILERGTSMSSGFG
ncbi:hypothetical protein BDF20DRAFT_672110 [Mycotypha africana]|uniref:uncharacterized protein n=1 Tax=Mycotypha africana TaxID=64632 RepID=UPI002301B313|nr:uncharacterized protein BDF20DRAFT_672110 [Mycotypha africana]KAI8973783.1 hypothetical protein BDF20DRAFT_672110 [Mycotypha africana]